MEAIHTLPNGDVREHEETTVCPCGPTVVFYENGAMHVCHNSFDGREALEQAEMLLYGEYQNGGITIDIRFTGESN